jgi:hypothetical protein
VSVRTAPSRETSTSAMPGPYFTTPFRSGPPLATTRYERSREVRTGVKHVRADCVTSRPQAVPATLPDRTDGGSVAAHGGGRNVSRIGRRAERAFLGAVMAMLAFMVERRVLRALKRTR